MHIALLFPTLPPALDGIGDYTARLATTLAGSHKAAVWTTDAEAADLPGVDVVRGVSFKQRTGSQSIAHAARPHPPDWVVVQYNPFSYGHRGFNLVLAPALQHLKRTHPKTRVAVMVHEPFVPVTNWRWALLTIWQRWQLWHLGRVADQLFFSIQPWAERFRTWFPNTPIEALPVGSNIPHTSADRGAIRHHWGVTDNDVVIGIFGTAHHSRRLPYIAQAARAAARKEAVHVLYVGPHGDQVREHIEDLPLHDAGRCSPADVSRHMQAMDLYLAPFEEGVSARRGSFHTGIQHGIATIGTRGAHTDDFLARAHGAAFMLPPDERPEAFVTETLRLAQNRPLRQRLAEEGQQFYDAHLDWPLIANRMVEALHRTKAPQHAPAG